MKKMTDIKVIVGLQAIATIVLLGVVFNLGMLPMMYFSILVAIFVTYWLFISLKTKKNKKKKRNIGYKLLSLVSSVLMLSVAVMGIQGTNLLNNVTGGGDVQTNAMSVIVLNDSGYEEISDIDGLVLGVNLATDTQNMEDTLELLEDEVSITQEEYISFTELSTALYDGEVDAILMNEAYRTAIENEYEYFSSDSTVIWSHEIEEEIESIVKEKDVTSQTFNIYVSGMDSYGSVTTLSCSDVNMILTVNPTTKEILMTSIPRDAYVEVDYGADYKDKLTHTGSRGINVSIETIENFMDIEINYYVKVNFSSVVDIIDALGGVNVYSQYSFTCRNGGYSITSGYNDLDGAEALGFVRERFSLPNGDYDRGINQTELLKALINKVTSPSIITGFTSFLNSIDGSFVTNMSSDDISSLIKMQINDMASWSFSTVQVEGVGGEYAYTASYPSQKLSVQYINADSLAEVSGYINDMMDGESITIEE